MNSSSGTTDALTADAKARRKAGCAGLIATAAALLLGSVLLWGAKTAEHVWLLHPLIALALSLAIVAGVRWLDGEIQLQPKRRGEKGHSAAGASILLWLACFVAIEVAFLLAATLDYAEEALVAPGGSQSKGNLPSQNAANAEPSAIQQGNEDASAKSGIAGH